MACDEIIHLSLYLAKKGEISVGFLSSEGIRKRGFGLIAEIGLFVYIVCCCLSYIIN